MEPKKKLIRITTVPISLKVLLRQQLRFMSAHFEVIGVSSPGKTLEEVADQEGIRTVPVTMTRSITPVNDLKGLWQLYRLLRKERPQIVHTHTPKAGLLGMMAGRLARIPIRMHTVAGLPLMESTGFRKKILEFTERLTYSCATKVYPNSRNLASFIIKNRYCSPVKLKVLGDGSSNGIDMDFFQLGEDMESSAAELRRKLNITNSQFVFLFVGRLVKDKGIEELIEAFTRLRQSYSDVKLLLVGPFEQELDPLSPKVKTIIEQDKDVVHVGFQQDIRCYLAISHALAFPSYREGFPNVPMQAGCFHLPSIVTDINGCNEIIEHGKNGLIIPAKNADALHNAMLALMTDKSLYLSLKANARKMILDRYEQNKFWKILLSEYQDQLNKHEILP
ncbi:MAG: glycosyltransferase family 4 protein [Chitinophagaceae bacterium]|nr:glycosyltransferase family 4 protein [Chitinophagaceae bacterium]